jgi:hypothetical protein
MDSMQWFHAWVAVAATVAIIASRKGRSGPLWLGYAMLMLPVALIHALALDPGKSQS